MKKTTTKLRLLLAAVLLSGLFGTGEVLASHAIGSDITYVNTAPNVYVVNYKLYRDCSGIDPGNSQQLTYRAPGCNANPVTVNMPRVGNPVNGSPYCASITLPPCNGASGSLSNYQEHNYQATITLPTLCTNWILSARIGNRPSSRNLANGQSAWLFSEAVINNVATQTNSSPVFKNISTLFVCVDRQYTFLQNVTDADGDSAVYTLGYALNDLNVPVQYGNYLGSGTGTNPYPAGTSPAGTPYPSANFSHTNPIISRNPLTIDRFTGSMVFEPLEYVGPSVPDNQGRDKYTVAVQVDEYRKINGVQVKIGHVRRDFLIIVLDCGQNYLPKLDSVRVRSLGYVPGSVIETGIGQPLEMTFNALDSNPQDIVSITSDAASVLPGATFTVGAGARPTGLFSWTPMAADIRSAPYYFTVTVSDNACPIKGTQTFSMGIRVTANGPTGISRPLSRVQFSAFPNPSDGNQITFKIKAEKPLKNAEVLIHNITGKMIERIPVSGGAGEEQVLWIKKADLPAGVYFARYHTTEETRTIKLVHLK